MKKNQKNKGQVMLLASLIIGGSILAATSVAGYLMLLKVRQSTDITNSSKAITAASSGIDWALYQISLGKNFSSQEFTFTNDSKARVTKSGTIITSIGNAGNSYRAFELDSEGADKTLE